MKLIYDTKTQKLLAWPRIDDEPVVGLAAHLLEMTVVQEEKPAYDLATQRLEKTEVIDTDTRTVTRGWNVVEVPVRIYTAEEWVQNYFSSLEIIALTRLEQSILQQGKVLGPKMQACKEWLEYMMFAQPSNAFLPAPYTYSEASIEAASTLNS